LDQSTETERNGAPVGSSNTRRYNVRTAAMLGIIIVAIFAVVAAAYSTTLPTTLAAPNQGHGSPMQANVTASQSASISITASMPSTQTQQLQTQTSMSMTTVQAPSTSVSQPATTIQTSTSVTVSQAVTSTVTTHTMTTTSLPARYCSYGCYYYPYPPYYSGYPGYYYYGGYPGYYYGGSYPGYYNGVPAFASVYACNGSGYSNYVQCTGYIYQAANGCVELVVQVVNPYSYTSALQYYTLHNLSTTPPSGTLVTVSGQMYRGYNTSSLGASCPGNYINVSSISTA